MIARLIKTTNEEIKLLCPDGTICNANNTVLYNFLINFKSADSFYGNDGFWNEEIPEMSSISGETLAIVTDTKELLIKDISAFHEVINLTNIKPLSVEEYAKKHGRSPEMIKAFIRQDRIPGVEKVGKSWIIPSNAPYPVSPNRKREVTWNPGRKKKEK